MIGHRSFSYYKKRKKQYNDSSKIIIELLLYDLLGVDTVGVCSVYIHIAENDLETNRRKCEKSSVVDGQLLYKCEEIVDCTMQLSRVKAMFEGAFRTLRIHVFLMFILLIKETECVLTG